MPKKLLQKHPANYDAYLGPGVENYLLSLKPAPVRFFLQMTGAKADRQAGVEQPQDHRVQGATFLNRMPNYCWRSRRSATGIAVRLRASSRSCTTASRKIRFT